MKNNFILTLTVLVLTFFHSVNECKGQEMRVPSEPRPLDIQWGSSPWEYRAPSFRYIRADLWWQSSNQQLYFYEADLPCYQRETTMGECFVGCPMTGNDEIIPNWEKKVLPDRMTAPNDASSNVYISIYGVFENQFSGERGYCLRRSPRKRGPGGPIDQIFYVKSIYCQTSLDAQCKLYELMYMNFVPDQMANYIYGHYQEGPGDLCLIGLKHANPNFRPDSKFPMSELTDSRRHYTYDESRIAFSRGPAAFVIRSEDKDVSCLEFAEAIDDIIQDVIKKVDSGENAEEE